MQVLTLGANYRACFRLFAYAMAIKSWLSLGMVLTLTAALILIALKEIIVCSIHTLTTAIKAILT